MEVAQGKKAPVKSSARIMDLEKEVKGERDKYQHILAEDKKYRGSLC